MTGLLRITAIFAALSAPLLAQEASIGFGGLSQDSSAPVEVASDSLEVDQANGAATFTGSVLVTQGALRLSADEVRVVYGETSEAADPGQISQLHAEGNVTLANGEEAAQAESAVYDISTGNVVMTGDVVLTQGETALSSERLEIDLNTGAGTMEGRVRSIFQTGGP